MAWCGDVDKVWQGHCGMACGDGMAGVDREGLMRGVGVEIVSVCL